MWSHLSASRDENDPELLPNRPTHLALAGALLLGACSPAGALSSLPLEGLDDRLATPSGELESTDALGLAYLIFGTRSILDAMSAASAELPGINRSPLFEHVDVVQCRSEEERGFVVDYDCLPETQGRLRVAAESGFANENGDYRLTFEGVSVTAGILVDGSAKMRVEGVANPTKVEKTSIAPTGFVDGLPERFRAVENTAIVVDNTRGKEKLSCLTLILEETYTWNVTDSRRDGEFGYSIRDKRNIWDCTSQIDGASIVSSECRTPVGQGDFAVLRF